MIKARLAEEQCPGKLQKIKGNYLDNRSILLRYMGCQATRCTNKGCVQGWIGGPMLWNLLLDPLLRTLGGAGDYCQAFADDVVLVFSGDEAAAIQRRGNAALGRAWEWGVANKLRFAPHKTKAMVITNKLKYDTPHLSMGGIDIVASKEIKILGLTIDCNMTFNAHVTNVCTKALGVYKQLSKAARVSWGLHPEVIRVIYNTTVEPIILYAAGTWAQAAKKKGVQKRFNAVQRPFAQKLCKAYKTVSLNAALVLAGLLPLDIRLRENALLYEEKKGVSRLMKSDTEVERKVDYTERPHPARHVHRQVQTIKDSTELEERVGSAVRIFTDGSKIEGKVGASLTV